MSGDTLSLVLLLLLVVGLLVVWLSSTAGRLDRLHHRIETTHAALDAALLRRGALATELALGGRLDPASSLVLAATAGRAREIELTGSGERELAESDLTHALAEVFPTPADADEVAPAGDAELAELAAACRRVELARRFHNDAVRACREVRRGVRVRLFRLAGHTPMPATVELDDTPPPGLSSR